MPQSVLFFCLSLSFVGAFAASGLEAGRLDYQETRLDNGLRVITLEDFACPAVAVDLWYHVGGKDVTPERQGIAHMLEHMTFRSMSRPDVASHVDCIHQVGGDCDGSTSRDQTVYVQTVPANQLDLALWLEAERMGFFCVDQSAFETERKVVEEERRLELNAPYGTLGEQVMAELFKSHPYRWTPIGKISCLRASSVSDLRAFWGQYYTPNNATLVIAGAVKHSDAQALAHRYFDWIPRGPEPPRVSVQEPMPEGPREVELSLGNAPAPLVGVAYRTIPVGHDDYCPLRLLENILAEGSNSRVNRRLTQSYGLGGLVLKPELADEVQCTDYTLEQDGVLIMTAMLPLSQAKPGKALRALQKEIARARDDKVSSRELEKAKNQMMLALVTGNLHLSDKANLLGRAAVLEGDVARVNHRLDDIRKISADDLMRVAKTYLAPNRALSFRVKDSPAANDGQTASAEDQAPVAGAPDLDPPSPARAGETPPPDFPGAPPRPGILECDPTEHSETRLLPNGLKVVVVESHEVPCVTVELGLRAGAWTETKRGCAAMAMSLASAATRKHSSGSLTEEIERYAIKLDSWAEMDRAGVRALCLTEQLDRAVNLMGEVVLAPAFKSADFERSKRSQATELKLSAADPSYLAERELRRRMYGAHPYARQVDGDSEDVEALRVGDLKQWWSTFVRPDMACLYFSGDIGMDRAMQLAESAFGAWKANGPKPEVQVPSIPEPAPTHIYLVDKPGNQSQIRIAQRGVTRAHPGYFAALVVSGYFGSDMGSRLGQSLRVKKGLTYGANGGYRTGRMAGEFKVGTFSKVETTPDAVRAAIDEIRSLLDAGPTEKELEDTKSYLAGCLARRNETPQSVVDDLWTIESEGLPEDYARQRFETIKTTDSNTCLQLAKETIDPAKLVIVVVGPAETLKAKLEVIAPVTVVEK
jgi:zinc protease